MRVARGWQNYELLDACCGERLERWGDYVTIRPDPQVIWRTPRRHLRWATADSVYHRSSSGGGEWEHRRSLPSDWSINWRDTVIMFVTPTSFKHTGVFPEQAANWDVYAELITAASRPIRVLNLFGYTGGATIASLKAGASVTHVDASKGMVAQARRNAALSSCSDKPARYIVDDCRKFVERELRRGIRYDAVIMDPPSFGRGPSGEVFKIEDDIFSLVELSARVLSDMPLFFAVNSYTSSLAPSAMGYILSEVFRALGGTVTCDEVGLKAEQSGFILPAGSTAMFRSAECG